MKQGKIFYGWWIVAGCVLITMTVIPVTMALSNKFLLQVTQEMNISRSSFSFINTILRTLGIFLSPFIAKKMAGGNMRKLQSLCIIGFVLAYGSYSLAQNVYHLYISALLVGVFFFGTTLIPVSIMITNWFVKKRGFAMSLAIAGIGVGGFIFSPVITWLLEAYGWRTAYQVMAVVIFVLAWPVSFFVLRGRPEDMGLKAYGADEAGQLGGKRKETRGNVSLSVREARTKPFFLCMLLGMFLCGFINSGALGQFPPAIQEMHGHAVQAAIISLYSLFGIFGKLAMGWVNDRFGVVASTAAGCACFALTFVCMLLGGNVSMLYVMAFIFGMGTGIGVLSPPLIVGEMFGKEKYGEAYGLAMSASQIGLSLGSLVVAGIYDYFQSYDYAWIMLFVLTCMTFVCWWAGLVMSRKYAEAATAAA